MHAPVLQKYFFLFQTNIYPSIFSLRFTLKITDYIQFISVNSFPIKLIYLYFYPLEVVSRYSDPQPQVTENYSYLRTNICKCCCLDTHFIPNISDLVD